MRCAREGSKGSSNDAFHRLILSRFLVAMQ